MTISEKIDYLKTYDVHCLIFGAGEHRYQLNPTISEEQIVAFEQQYSIKLPEDYRHFLKTVGNGGAG